MEKTLTILTLIAKRFFGIYLKVDFLERYMAARQGIGFILWGNYQKFFKYEPSNL